MSSTVATVSAPLGSGGVTHVSVDEAIRLQREEPTVVGMPLAIIVSLEKQGTSTSRFINTVLGATNQRPMWSSGSGGEEHMRWFGHHSLA